MGEPHPKADAWFDKAERWRDELAALRAVVLDTPLTEEFKWRSPCYTCQGSNLAAIWSMKAFCGLSFFKGVLLSDPEGILIPPGPHSRSVRVARFTSVEEVDRATGTLNAYVAEAIEAEKAGRTVEFEDAPDLPEELARRLEADAKLKAAFEALTPGRQRGWAIHVSQPKKPETRVSRIEKAAPRILEGKGLHDR